jgi:hypothetical protein
MVDKNIIQKLRGRPENGRIMEWITPELFSLNLKPGARHPVLRAEINAKLHNL